MITPQGASRCTATTSLEVLTHQNLHQVLWVKTVPASAGRYQAYDLARRSLHGLRRSLASAERRSRFRRVRERVHTLARLSPPLARRARPQSSYRPVRVSVVRGPLRAVHPAVPEVAKGSLADRAAPPVPSGTRTFFALPGMIVAPSNVRSARCVPRSRESPAPPAPARPARGAGDREPPGSGVPSRHACG